MGGTMTTSTWRRLHTRVRGRERRGVRLRKRQGLARRPSRVARRLRMLPSFSWEALGDDLLARGNCRRPNLSLRACPCPRRARGFDRSVPRDEEWLLVEWPKERDP